jgi:glycosyltransferase involved in cell wall biosynthesis
MSMIETASTIKTTVIIATHNRADDLRETLASLAALSTEEPWELLVVDNNSTDATPQVVAEATAAFPVDLRYIFEGEQGRCAALNAGIRAARGDVIVTTDDDVRVEPNWLDQARAALGDLGCDYVGGKVLPVWSGTRPEWLPNREGRHWAVLALLDYGDQPLEFERRVPLGVNMAFRRDAFSRAGLWDNRVGRKAGTLLGQEVREWGLRARAAGLRGFYAPGMMVRHVIPPERLSKRYFRRWFYWHGVSRAMLYENRPINMEAPEQTVLDYSAVPHIGGVPRYLFRTCLKSAFRMLSAAAKREPVATFENELWLWFFAGIVKQRWKDTRRGKPATTGPGLRTDEDSNWRSRNEPRQTING